jgi:hypothetical protein
MERAAFVPPFSLPTTGAIVIFRSPLGYIFA